MPARLPFRARVGLAVHDLEIDRLSDSAEFLFGQFVGDDNLHGVLTRFHRCPELQLARGNHVQVCCPATGFSGLHPLGLSGVDLLAVVEEE